jgi:hypothetical protein
MNMIGNLYGHFGVWNLTLTLNNNTMKKDPVKNRIVWTIAALAALCVCYLLSRYTFFELHGMKQWPLVLFVTGLIVIIVAAFIHGHKLMVCTVVGYIGGFALGMFFNTDGVDYGGGSINNAWWIWTVSFIVFILIGVVFEIVSRHIKKRKIS